MTTLEQRVADTLDLPLDEADSLAFEAMAVKHAPAPERVFLVELTSTEAQYLLHLLSAETRRMRGCEIDLYGRVRLDVQSKMVNGRS